MESSNVVCIEAYSFMGETLFLTHSALVQAAGRMAGRRKSYTLVCHSPEGEKFELDGGSQGHYVLDDLDPGDLLQVNGDIFYELRSIEPVHPTTLGPKARVTLVHLPTDAGRDRVVELQILWHEHLWVEIAIEKLVKVPDDSLLAEVRRRGYEITKKAQ